MMDRSPVWPVLGPPQGVWADIWPLGESRVHEPIYKPTDRRSASATRSDASAGCRARRFLQRRRGRARRRAVRRRLAAGARQSSPRISTTDLGGATLFQGAGCNVIAMPGKDGALMIDGGLAANADALLAAVRNATGNTRIHTLINTHWHPEQTGANEAVGRDGGVIFAHEKTQMYLSNTGLRR